MVSSQRGLYQHGGDSDGDGMMGDGCDKGSDREKTEPDFSAFMLQAKKNFRERLEHEAESILRKNF